MAPSPQSAESLEQRANRLYWNSSETVDEILGQLGMSRTALYGVVDPLPAEGSCPACGGSLVFMNRSQRSARRVTCAACEERFDLDALTAEIEEAMAADADWQASAPAAAGGWRSEITQVPMQRVALIGGAAALGILLGLAAARVLRDRA